MFRGCRAEDMPPHIYACAQQAYRSMLSARADQAIVLSGRSGSGKSTNVRHLVHYFTVVAGSSPNNVINGKARRPCGCVALVSRFVCLDFISTDGPKCGRKYMYMYLAFVYHHRQVRITAL